MIELYQVLICPLSRATRNDPIGSNTENCREVTLISFDFETLSNLPKVIFDLPLASSLIAPKKTFPSEVPIAKFTPLGLKTAVNNSSS